MNDASSVLCAPSLPPAQEYCRAKCMAVAAIDRYKLNLSGFTVFTEAASGAYRYTACVAALAGARVLALARSSSWGSASSIAQEQPVIARHWGLAEGPQIIFEKSQEAIHSADIICNTGHVRPLDACCIQWMRPTAVIPLMWETYEWRPDELDLSACKNNDILVLGTDETKMGFLDFVPETLIKLLHSAGIAIRGGRFLYLATGPITEAVLRQFTKLGAEVSTSAWEQCQHSPRFLSPHSPDFLPYLERCDALICDERFDKRQLLGEHGIVNIQWLKEHCPSIVVVNRHGMFDAEALEQSSLHCIPDAKQVPWHKPLATTAILGLRPTLELMVAGLKVGEAMARARGHGLSLVQAAAQALAESPAQDFAPPYNWIS